MVNDGVSRAFTCHWVVCTIPPKQWFTIQIAHILIRGLSVYGDKCFDFRTVRRTPGSRTEEIDLFFSS